MHLKELIIFQHATPKTELVKKSIEYMSAYLWNNSDDDMGKITCLENFKHAVKKLPSGCYALSFFKNYL